MCPVLTPVWSGATRAKVLSASLSMSFCRSLQADAGQVKEKASSIITACGAAAVVLE
jgi:hypothetical protein